jgi:hypothetical protein
MFSFEVRLTFSLPINIRDYVIQKVMAFSISNYTLIKFFKTRQ